MLQLQIMRTDPLPANPIPHANHTLKHRKTSLTFIIFYGIGFPLEGVIGESCATHKG